MAKRDRITRKELGENLFGGKGGYPFLRFTGVGERSFLGKRLGWKGLSGRWQGGIFAGKDAVFIIAGGPIPHRGKGAYRPLPGHQSESSIIKGGESSESKRNALFPRAGGST